MLTVTAHACGGVTDELCQQRRNTMKPETMIDPMGQLERRSDLADLLVAVEGVPSHHQAAMMSRILKDVVAGKISAAEANEIRKAAKI